MSFSDKIRELDRGVVDRVEQALSDLRRELGDRLRQGTEDILHRFEEVRPHLPASLFGSSADVDTVEQQVRSAARRGAFTDLREALAAIDAARSQSEILNALLAGSAAFSSRAALLLVRGGELKGWGSRGFPEGEPGIREVAIPQEEGGAWVGLAEDRGVIHLSPADSATLVSRLESPLPQEAVLVPLVLRDRTAAALYADRTGDDELAVEALQALAFAAAQTIETLPFRERASTSTLRASVGREEAAGGDPSQWSVAAPPAPEASAEPEAEPEPELVAAAPAPETETAATGDPSQWGAAPAPAPEESATGDPSQWGLASAPLPAPEPEQEPEPAVTGNPAAWGQAGAWGQAKAEPAPDSGRETVLLRRPVAVPEPPPEPEPAAAAGSSEDDTEPSSPAEPAPRLRPVGFTHAADGDETASRGAGPVEVPPPTDVQGPGWAFATTRVPVAPDEETLHEEARRLARLLVSEIKLYNEDQVEEGRRNRDLYERLKEDIDRSRQMYEERVDPRLLHTTDYFYQELVRILASGDAKALGI